MSYSFYKILHFISILALFLSLGAIMARAYGDLPKNKILTIIHGVAMFFILLAGFGLLARLGLTSGFPLWVWAKLAIWVLLGIALLPIKKKMLPPILMFILILALGGVGAYLAHMKPF